MAKKKTLIRRGEVNEIDLLFLLSGVGNSNWRFFEGGLDDAFLAWQRIGHNIVARWIEQRPGSRPWAWWRFDSVEPRLLVDGTQSDSPEWAFTNYGMCGAVRFVEGVRQEENFESEYDYLLRHNLLTESEKSMSADLLRAGTFDEPEIDDIKSILGVFLR